MSREWQKYLKEISKTSQNKNIPKSSKPLYTLDQILSSITETLGMTTGVLGLVQGNEYTLYMVYEEQPSGLRRGMVFPLGITFAEQIVNRESAYSIDDVSKNPVFKTYPEYTKWHFQSYLGAPVFNEQGDVAAVLAFLSTDSREFKEAEHYLVEMMGQEVARILTRTKEVGSWSQEDWESYAQADTRDTENVFSMTYSQLEALENLAMITKSSLDENEIEQRALQELIEMSRAKYGSIVSVDEDGETLVMRTVVGVSRNFLVAFNDETRHQIDVGPMGKAIRERKPVIVSDLFSEHLGRVLRKNAEQWGYAAIISIPLIQHNQKATDVVNLYYRFPQRFDSSQVKFLTAAASHLGAAISNITLIRHSETEHQLVSLVNEVANALTSSINFNDIFLTLVNGLEKIVQFDHANITLLDEEKKELFLFALISSKVTRLKEGYRFTREREPLLWSSIYQRKISFVRDLTHLPTELNDMLIQEGMQSSIALPLIYKGEPLGIFLLASSRLNNFMLREATILEQITIPIASAIKNASLYVETVKQRETLDRINRELQRLDQIKQDLTDMIIHDLRNPLSGIIGYLSLLMQYTKLDDQQREFADLAKSNSETMLNMVNTLLDITKLEVGQMNIDRQNVLVSEIISAAFNQTRGMALPKNVSLEYHLERPDLQVNADAQLLVRVLVNLVGNAIKFVPDNGNVQVDAYNENGDEQTPYTVFKVVDNGEGIPTEYHDKIFEKFGQVDIRKKGDKVSTGLGLTFCKLAVQAHGGKIEVSSEPGKGSTFVFEIPHLSHPGDTSHRRK